MAGGSRQLWTRIAPALDALPRAVVQGEPPVGLESAQQEEWSGLPRMLATPGLVRAEVAEKRKADGGDREKGNRPQGVPAASSPATLPLWTRTKLHTQLDHFAQVEPAIAASVRAIKQAAGEPARSGQDAFAPGAPPVDGGQGEGSGDQCAALLRRDSAPLTAPGAGASRLQRGG